jgi:hypothetical protein
MDNLGSHKIAGVQDETAQGRSSIKKVNRTWQKWMGSIEIHYFFFVLKIVRVNSSPIMDMSTGQMAWMSRPVP